MFSLVWFFVFCICYLSNCSRRLTATTKKLLLHEALGNAIYYLISYIYTPIATNNTNSIWIFVHFLFVQTIMIMQWSNTYASSESQINVYNLRSTTRSIYLSLVLFLFLLMINSKLHMYPMQQIYYNDLFFLLLSIKMCTIRTQK